MMVRDDRRLKGVRQPAVGNNWPWRGRAVWGCSSAGVSWHRLPPLPVRPADLCDRSQEWRGGSRRSQHSSHYWPERRSEGGGWRGQEVRMMGMEEMERVRMGWRMKNRWNKFTKKWLMIDSMNFSAVDHRLTRGVWYRWSWDGCGGSDGRSWRWRWKLHFSLIDDLNFIMHVTLPHI